MNKYRAGILLITAFGLIYVFHALPGHSAGSKNKEGAKAEESQENPRAQLRAFYTAPPVIPHEVSERKPNECLYCHKSVMRISGRTSVKMPHPQFYNCEQCHVPAHEMEIPVATSWEGLKEPKKSARAFESAPPAVPHRTFLREDCLSCHGPDSPNEQLHTSHPKRTSCLQCHILDPDNEF